MPSLSLSALVNGLLTVVDMTKTIGAKVEDETYEVFRLVCENEGVTPSDRLRDLVNKFVKEEAPFLVVDPNVCLELKRIAEEKGLDWREMTCEAILKFCRKCSQEKEAPTEEEEKKETVTVIHPDGSKQKVPKESIKILKESVFKKEEGSTEEQKPKKSLVSILKEAKREI